MAFKVVTLSLVFRAISSRVTPLVWRSDATLQSFRGNVAMPAPVYLYRRGSRDATGFVGNNQKNLVLSPQIRRVREMPGSPLKLAAPVPPTLRCLSSFDKLRFG